jgi:hypothetical protein
MGEGDVRGDIIQDQATGWFYRDNGDGSLVSLSDHGSPTVGPDAMSETTCVLVRDGAVTGTGDPLAARVAVVLARRFA